VGDHQASAVARLPPQTVKRYEVRWASFDPTRGAEMAKARPAVILSLDTLNQRLQTVTICPLTTQLHPAWRTRLGCRVGGQNAEIAVDQTRTISKARIGKKLGALSSEEARALRRLMTEMYGE
jgi:mRNA interferase MazF